MQGRGLKSKDIFADRDNFAIIGKGLVVNADHPRPLLPYVGEIYGSNGQIAFCANAIGFGHQAGNSMLKLEDVPTVGRNRPRLLIAGGNDEVPIKGWIVRLQKRGGPVETVDEKPHVLRWSIVVRAGNDVHAAACEPLLRL